MKSPASKVGLLAALLVLLGAGIRVGAESEEAYVTLLYGDEFVLGVRVLGKSIRETGSTKDMVVLYSDGVSEYSQRLLKADGWKMEHISLLANPNNVRPKRFWGVYTKLKIFNMTRYKKVVYLDADTIVVKSIEDLFKCGKFCANLKHSERMNSGVMVVEPSESLFKDMMSKVNTLYSYTGGDQGFLNSFYADFPNAHVFEPNKSSEISSSEPELQRLSTLYNADVGLYMLANKWMVDEQELRVIHYTLGPLKPWDWWTAWLVKPVEVWQNVRERLEESLPGTGGGRNPHDQLVVRILFILPFCLLFFGIYQPCLQTNKNLFSLSCQSYLCAFARRVYYKYKSGGVLPTYSNVGVASSSIANSNQQVSNGTHSKLPAYLGAISILFCFISAAISLALAYIIIPEQVLPWTGLLLMYEWTFATFFITFECYINFVYQWGKATASQVRYDSTDSSEYGARKGHQHSTPSCEIVTWFYWLGMSFLAVTPLLLPSLLGVTALFARLGLMVVGGLILASFMTYASEHLAIRAFVKGQNDRHLPRTRSKCFLC
ncbi:inositol phosphorylceramide glucuronosyltransferase 1 [Typha latifolia]|uniref:inositol phosphorylceramide glucuronosyltransferase 1 n=1 Tax=Typha latifolia TaxID=4733 RepID=UPI003C2E99DC